MKINDLLLRLTKEKYLNRWIIFLIDLFLSVFSTVTSLALVSYILDWNYTDQIILTVFLASLFCSTASFLVCQTYKGIIRHSAFTETGRIAMSSSLKVATILPVLLFTTGLLSFRGFLLGSVVDFFLTFFILTIFRAFLITLYTFMVSSIASNRKDKRLRVRWESCHRDVWSRLPVPCRKRNHRCALRAGPPGYLQPARSRRR